MRSARILVIALVLVFVGLAGLAILPVVGSVAVAPSFTSNGQRIYETGADASGPVPRTIGGGNCGTAAGASCADCHGIDGRGGRVTPVAQVTFVAPDIRYSSLTAPFSDESTTVPGLSDAQIGTAIRDGVDENGQPLAAPMPRWTMTDADLADTIAYLKELSTR